MKTIIWDFNGTILNDVEYCLEILNELLSYQGNPKQFSLDEYKEVFGFPIIDYYHRAGIDFEKNSFEELANIYMKRYYSIFGEIRLHDNFMQTILALKAKGYKNVIISASKQSDLKDQTNNLRIDWLFDEIIGIDNIYASSKVERAIKWSKESRFSNYELYFIGDTTHDAEVAKSINAKCILVANGHESYDRLKLANEIVLNDISEVLECIE